MDDKCWIRLILDSKDITKEDLKFLLDILNKSEEYKSMIYPSGFAKIFISCILHEIDEINEMNDTNEMNKYDFSDCNFENLSIVQINKLLLHCPKNKSLYKKIALNYLGDIALLNCQHTDLLVHTTNIEDFKRILGDSILTNDLFVPEFLQYPSITRLFGDFNTLVNKISINKLIRFIHTDLLEEYDYIINVIIEQFLNVSQYLNIFQDPDDLCQYLIHISSLDDSKEMIKKFIFLKEQLCTELPVIFFTNERDICKFKKVMRDIYKKGNIEFIQHVEEFISMYYTDILIHDFFVFQDIRKFDNITHLAELCPEFKKMESTSDIEFIKDVIFDGGQINFSALKRYLLYNNVDILSECDKKTIMQINTENNLSDFIINFKYKYLIEYNITIPRIKLRLSVNTKNKIPPYLLINVLHNDINFSEFIYLFENWKYIFDVPFKEEIKSYIVNIMIKLNDSKYIIWLHLLFKTKLMINEVECGLYKRLHSKNYDLNRYGIQTCNNESISDFIYRLLFLDNTSTKNNKRQKIN